MNCTRTDQGTEVWLRIEGALDALTAPDLRPIFDSVIESRRTRVTLDLAPLTMIDSSGIGAIVSLYKRVKADGGQVVVTGITGQPLSVFKLLKLDRVFSL